MNEAARIHIQKFNDIIKYCDNYCVMTRDSRLQRDAIAKLQAMIVDCGDIKLKAVAHEDEEFANILLGFECVAQCLCAELEMWIFLKEEKPDEAWDRLVAAQMAAVDSVRAHRTFAHNEAQAARLEEIERLVFPPQVFVSAGMIVRHQECSICGSEYGDCEHLAGKPYWGKFCYIIARDFEPHHIAIVKSPADKRCRIMGFSVDNGECNRMTWRVGPPQLEQGHEPDSPGEIQRTSEGASDKKGLVSTARLIHSDLVKKRRG
jgi:hypothetical protein